MDQNPKSWIGTIVGSGCDIDDYDRITDCYITVAVSKDMDTLTIRVSPELSHLYYIGRVVQISINNPFLVVTILR